MNQVVKLYRLEYNLNKEPNNTKTKFSIYWNSSDGFQEKRDIALNTQSVLEDFDLPLKKLDDIK